jgi:hypothetical protein
MALKSPDTGQLIQTVHVNGYSYHPSYQALAKYMEVGKHADLVAEPSNLHDKNAVKVCFSGAQVGWVPKTENKEIARRLKAGEKLRAEITHHHRYDLRLAVYGKSESLEPSPGVNVLATVRITGKPSGDPDAFDEIASYSIGTCFPLMSASTRVSISLGDPNHGRDLGWFRKSELPLRNASTVTILAERGRLVAVKRDDGQFDLYQKGWEPKTPAEPPKLPPLQFGTVFNNPLETTKENTMNFAQTTNSLINNNKSAASQAGYLEAGRIANNQFTKLAAKSLPMMLRGYADTAVGKLVIANLAQMAASHLRPQDATLAKLTGAMTVAAYQGVIQTVDIEGWLNELLGSPEIKRAMDKLNVVDAASEERVRPVVQNV